MVKTGDFPGLTHDVSRTDEGISRVRPRESLAGRILSIIKTAREVGFPARLASKLYEVSNFIRIGMFGRIGRAGLWTMKDRQNGTVFELTPPINLPFGLLSNLFKLRPQREYLLWDSTMRRATTASDAAYEIAKAAQASWL